MYNVRWLYAIFDDWPRKIRNDLCKQLRGAKVTQWWKHSPPPMWPGFKSRRRRHMWVEFVVCCFSPGTPFFPCPQKPTCPNSNSISNARTRSNEFIRTPKCSVGEQIIITSYSYKFFTITVTLTNWPLTFQPRKVNHSEGRFHIIQKEEKGHLSAIGEGRAPRRPSESAYDSHCRAISHVHRRGSKFKNLSQEDNCSGN